MPLHEDNPFNAFNAPQAAQVSDAGKATLEQFDAQQQKQVDNTSAWDTTKAAFESNNVLGAAFYGVQHMQHQADNPDNFDALDHIPAGYETQADYFATAKSPADIEWRREYLDHKNEMQRTISANPKLGFVASLASGLVDPINVASMAIPIAGETRLARFGYSAVQMAATTATQEAVFRSFDPTRTGAESLFNIGTSSLLGGVLGAALRPKVPRGAFNDLAEKAMKNPEGTLGDPTVRVLNDVPHNMDIPPIKAEPESIKRPSTNYYVDDEGNHVVTSDNGISMARQRGNSLQQISTETLPEAQGAGEGTARTERLIQEAKAQGLDYTSDTKVSAAAQKMYAKLEQKGYGITKNPASLDEEGNLVSDAGKPVFEVKQAEGIGAPSDGFGHVNMDESTVGAAQVRGPTLQTERVAPGAQSLVEGPLGKLTPGGRLLSSPFLTTRQLTQRLGNVNQVMVKNMEGEASAVPIERKLWKAEGTWTQALENRDDLYKQYSQRLKETGEQKLSRTDWNEQVSHAMRNGDKHGIPEVQQAAQVTREKVINPYWERARAAAADGKLQLPEESKLYADSYLMRQYDAQKIRANTGEFLNTLTNHFVSQGVDPLEARDIAHQGLRNVIGAERGTMDWKVFDDVVAKTGRLKERTLSVPDNVLEPWLNNDIDHLTHSYLRSMAPTVEMAEEFGSIDLKDQIQEIKDEAGRAMERAIAKGDTQGAADLLKRSELDVNDIAAVRDRLYGTYGAPKDPGSFFVRAGRMLRLNNAWRLLGGATISHIPDFANVISKYGLGNTIQATMKLASSMDAIQLTRSEGHRMALGLDMAMSTASLLGGFGSHSQFAEQRIGQKIAKGFTIITGETPLISMIQMWASTIGQDSLLRTAERVSAGQTVGKNTLVRMASAGLDESMLKRIAAEHAANGQEVNGLKFGMSDLWKDKEAQTAFETAILKDAHGTTLRPGVLDTPLFMSTEMGKMILQFKSFGFAAQTSVLQPALQGVMRGDPRAISGIMALTAAGAASYVLKQKAAGQPIETDNPGRFALEIADKSNLMGWMSELIFPSLWQMGFKDLSRWSDRDPSETLLGPSVGTVTSTLERRIPAKLTSGPEDTGDQFKRSDLHFLRRTFLPAQNLWWARRGINDAEDAVGNAFDLPGESNKARREAAGQ